MALLYAQALGAEPVRIASWTVELSRKHAALLYRDLVQDKAQDAAHLAQVVAQVAPDVLIVQGFDYDHDTRALAAWSAMIEAAGHSLPHLAAWPPNTGQMTGLDLNGDGRLGDPQDAQGYGWFAGQGGMAILSRYPLTLVADHSAVLWASLPWATRPQVDDAPFPSAEAQAVQRLPTTAHWEVRADTPEGPLTLLTSYHSPPVFDGPEDRNGLRNADELRFWHRDIQTRASPFVLVGNFNLDPYRGEGRRPVMRSLLEDPRVQDTAPMRTGSEGDPATARFDGVGPLQVSHILPSADLHVLNAGIVWPEPLERPRGQRLTRHGLIWADLMLRGRGEGG